MYYNLPKDLNKVREFYIFKSNRGSRGVNMIFNQNSFIGEKLRDIFCNTVIKVFGSTDTFLDFIENEEYSDEYNCYIDYSGENYIINRNTGEYINWYKFAHIGRCINISTSLSNCNDIPKWVEGFLIALKRSQNK